MLAHDIFHAVVFFLIFFSPTGTSHVHATMSQVSLRRTFAVVFACYKGHPSIVTAFLFSPAVSFLELLDGCKIPSFCRDRGVCAGSQDLHLLVHISKGLEGPGGQGVLSLL